MKEHGMELSLYPEALILGCQLDRGGEVSGSELFNAARNRLGLADLVKVPASCGLMEGLQLHKIDMAVRHILEVVEREGGASVRLSVNGGVAHRETR